MRKLFLAALLFLGCNEKEHKIIKEKWEDGTPKIVHVYPTPGDTSSFYKVEYFRTGNKESESFIRNGKTEGKKTTWYENGSLRSESIYKNGALHEKAKYWYPNGILREHSTFNNGIQLGEFEQWDTNGVILMTGETLGIDTLLQFDSIFNDSIMVAVAYGHFIYFYPNGVKKEETKMNKGQNGSVTYYSEDQKILREEKYQNGILIKQ